MKQYFIPPFYLVDILENIQYNLATKTLELPSKFNSKDIRELNDKEVLILNKKILEAKL